MPRTLPTSRGKPGPKSAYDPDKHPELAYAICLTGTTMRGLADCLGISIPCLYQWMGKHEELYKAIKSGRDLVDTEVVERALVDAAKGREYCSKVSERFDKDGNLVSRTEEFAALSPNVVASIFYLKNRQPGRWRDTRESLFAGRWDETRNYNMQIGIGDGNGKGKGKPQEQIAEHDTSKAGEILAILDSAGVFQPQLDSGDDPETEQVH